MKKPVIILLHVGYWAIFNLLLFVLFGLTNAATAEDPNRDFDNLLQWQKLMFGTTILPAILCFYGYYTILFNWYLNKRKIAAFFIAAIVIAILSALAGVLVGSMPIFIGPLFVFKNFWTAVSMILFLAFVAMLSGIVGLVIRGFITWYSEIKIKEELTQQNFNMEMALVKSQINPHFLFNTLNNIDVLIAKDPERASQYLLSLSDILRFTLYETKPDSILLSKEIEYIEKFIALHQIRSNNADYVHFSVKGDSPNLSISPMLFIPFIENAFKHVTDKKASPAIDILITINKATIYFECSNNFRDEPIVDTEHSGLGDGLIRRRLQLLYPDKHELDITTTNQIYKVALTINCL